MSHPRKIPERKEELDFGNTPTHIFTKYYVNALY